MKKTEVPPTLWSNIPQPEVSVSTSPDPTIDVLQRECSQQEYDFMKENLLLFNNAKLMDSKKSGIGYDCREILRDLLRTQNN